MKFAYCIIAHNEPLVLQRLLNMIDDYSNEIYLHVDRKSKSLSKDLVEGWVKKSTIHVYSEYSVGWGGDNMIWTELFLFKNACQTKHDYYHLLSGVDLPIKSRLAIQQFFNENNGKEFVGVNYGWTARNNIDIDYRYKVFHFFGDRVGKDKHNALFIPSRLLSIIQYKLLPFDRSKHTKLIYYGGSQWVSITHNFAKYLVSKQSLINKLFKDTFCCDEVFIQTILLNSPFRANVYLNGGESVYDACLRYLSFNVESPRSLSVEDYQRLKTTKAIFARKFSASNSSSMQLVEQLYSEFELGKGIYAEK